jgi:thiamine biosynthesis lipoprotein
MAADASGLSLSLRQRTEDVVAACFQAMASPCEILLSGCQPDEALSLAEPAAQEALRVERKFSRYRDDSVLAWIHRNRGTELTLDAETASLLDFAAQCFELSGGLFDITSGVLRRVWKFDGSDQIPRPEAVASLVKLIGFDKVTWLSPRLLLPREMELDFGGMGKEYAVDRAYELLAATCTRPFLVNFGGDLRASGPPAGGSWQVGIERSEGDGIAAMLLELQHGALATSGDSHRFLLKDGVRYSHILNPRTGWPVVGAPRSVTVAASSCTEAGLLSTLALLQGERAAAFLAEQGVRHWIVR